MYEAEKEQQEYDDRLANNEIITEQCKIMYAKHGKTTCTEKALIEIFGLIAKYVRLDEREKNKKLEVPQENKG